MGGELALRPSVAIARLAKSWWSKRTPPFDEYSCRSAMHDAWQDRDGIKRHKTNEKGRCKFLAACAG